MAGRPVDCGPAAGRVGAVDALRHDAFEALPFCLREELVAVSRAVSAERDQLVPW
jgi:hypothetical protein